ncbi:MAG: hypothetical protein L6R38_007582 [Xanthoria sp. 2 TBL-2021]|nr:MAG: hypothetical protein L6R38_007582 [Xanthoria sp. 2 TBL-2021]
MPSSPSPLVHSPEPSNVESWVDQLQSPSNVDQPHPISSPSPPTPHLGDNPPSQSRKRKWESFEHQIAGPRRASWDNLEVDTMVPPRQPQTPQSSKVSSRSYDNLPDTPLSQTSHNVRQTLADHGMHINNPSLELKYKTLHSVAEKCMGRTRDSAMRTASAKHISQWLKAASTLPEDDIVWQLVPMIAPNSRTVKEPKESTSATDSGEVHILVSKFFSDDGVICTRNRQFTPDLLPSWDKPAMQAIQKKMEKEKEPGMSNAKPDFAFGIMANCHPDIDSERFSQRIRAIIGVVPYITHPFLIIEGKSNRGSIADAENQALRGGSTLVRARRLLNGFARGWKMTSGADHESFLFSMTIDPRVATIWLHWCEVRVREKKAGGEKNSGKGKEPAVRDDEEDEGETFYETYHMNQISQYLLSDTDHARSCRRELHNIMDWGCSDRMDEIRKVMTKVHEHERAEKEHQVDSPSKKRARNE